MGISWAVDANPSQVYDMPPKPELSSRGTIVNREKDNAAHYYRDVQRYPSPFMNESSYRPSEGSSSRDPRTSHYQNSMRESARGSYSSYPSHPGNSFQPPPPPPPPPMQYALTPRQPDYYPRTTHHPSRTSSLSSSDRYESPSPIPRTQLSRQDKGKVPSKSAEGPSGFDDDRHEISHRNKDRPNISSRESSREPLRESAKEPSAAQVTNWISVSPKDARQIMKFSRGKGGMVKNLPKTLAEYHKFALAVELGDISWDAPKVMAIDFVYDVPVFPPPSVSTLKKSAAQPPPPASGDEGSSHKKPRIEPTSTDYGRSSIKHSRVEPTSTEYERSSSRHLTYDRSNDQKEKSSSRHLKIESSSKPSTSSNGSANGNTDVHVARPLATTIVPADATTFSTDMMTMVRV
jgi:hypothetical protein